MLLKGADRLNADIESGTQNRLAFKHPNHVIIHASDFIILMSGMHWNHNVVACEALCYSEQKAVSPGKVPLHRNDQMGSGFREERLSPPECSGVSSSERDDHKSN